MSIYSATVFCFWKQTHGAAVWHSSRVRSSQDDYSTEPQALQQLHSRKPCTVKLIPSLEKKCSVQAGDAVWSDCQSLFPKMPFPPIPVIPQDFAPHSHCQVRDQHWLFRPHPVQSLSTTWVTNLLPGANTEEEISFLTSFCQRSLQRRFPAAAFADQRPSGAAFVWLWHILEAVCRKITRRERINSKLNIKHKISPPRQCCLGLVLCVL